jgi:uncharacterized protein YdeI (YjbR/CyaY-like superfamily)
MTDAAPPNSTHPQFRADWRAWLNANHQRTEGVWLIMWKKAGHKPLILYDELVEEALCFGWIDSKPRALYAERSMLWFAPRKPGTGWSRLKKERVARAIAAGRMTPAGLEKINAAKRDGSWTALDAVEALELPPDVLRAFAVYPSARENFEAFPRFTKRSILEWIGNAETSATRDKRIEETARRAAVNERANQWRKKA